MGMCGLARVSLCPREGLMKSKDLRTGGGLQDGPFFWEAVSH